MSVDELLSPATARRQSKGRAALVAAYREGLGLAAVAVIRGPGGIRVAAIGLGGNAGPSAALEIIEQHWWCRRAAEAERLAAAAMARWRRHESRTDARPAASAASHDSPADIAVAVENAAQRLAIVVYSDHDISREAEGIIARVEDEIEKLRQVGEMKTVNRGYRSYRMQASARGQKVLPYAEWLNKYKQNLVRELATALRYV